MGGEGGGGLQRRVILPVKKICPHQHLDKPIQVNQSFQPAHASTGRGGWWDLGVPAGLLCSAAMQLQSFSLFLSSCASYLWFSVWVEPETRLKSVWSLAQTTDPAKVGSVLSRSSGSVFSPLTDLAREDIKVVILPPCRCRGYLLVISAAYLSAHTSRLY